MKKPFVTVILKNSYSATFQKIARRTAARESVYNKVAKLQPTIVLNITVSEIFFFLNFRKYFLSS